MFDYVGLFSAGVDFSMVDMDQPAYANLDEKWRIQAQKEPALYWIACGTDDFLYNNNKEILRHLDEAGMKYVWHESTRGHLWSNWRQYFLIFAPQLFK